MTTINYYKPRSKTGRVLSAPPKNVKLNPQSQKKWDIWLLSEAMIEATKFEKVLLTSISNLIEQKKGKGKRASNTNLTRADYDTINLILFGDIDVNISYSK